MIDMVLRNATIFLLVAARAFAMIMTLPLFSSQSVSRYAKLALAGYMAYFITPQISLASGPFAQYAPHLLTNGLFTAEYVLLVLGEGLLGVVIGFYIQIIFAAFSTAGQFFAFQMGFSAAEAYDSLNQVENPLMGQYLNLIAMLIFMQNHWFQTLFINGFLRSFDTLSAFSVAENTDALLKFMLLSLSRLFFNALVIALPVMGTLFLINVTVGVLAKAAPQMNLLSEGFPILMLTSFFVITQLMPYLCEFFVRTFHSAFRQMQFFLAGMGQGALP